jgi:5-oxoprolinase (ATP-hydrolysing)
MGLADQIAMREQAVERRWTPMRWPRLRSSTLPGRWPTARRTGPGRRAGAAVRRTGACTCATRAPTPRWSSVACGDAARGGCSPRRLRAAYRQRFAFLMPGKAWWSRRCRSRPWAPATRRPSRATPLHPPREVPRRSTVRMYTGGQWHDAALVVREDLRPGDVIPARPSLPSATPPPWSSPAGRRS